MFFKLLIRLLYGCATLWLIAGIVKATQFLVSSIKDDPKAFLLYLLLYTVANAALICLGAMTYLLVKMMEDSYNDFIDDGGSWRL